MLLQGLGEHVRQSTLLLALTVLVTPVNAYLW